MEKAVDIRSRKIGRETQRYSLKEVGKAGVSRSTLESAKDDGKGLIVPVQQRAESELMLPMRIVNIVSQGIDVL